MFGNRLIKGQRPVHPGEQLEQLAAEEKKALLLGAVRLQPPRPNGDKMYTRRKKPGSNEFYTFNEAFALDPSHVASDFPDAKGKLFRAMPGLRPVLADHPPEELAEIIEAHKATIGGVVLVVGEVWPLKDEGAEQLASVGPLFQSSDRVGTIVELFDREEEGGWKMPDHHIAYGITSAIEERQSRIPRPIKPQVYKSAISEAQRRVLVESGWKVCRIHFLDDRWTEQTITAFLQRA